MKGHDDEFFIYADGKRMYALTVSSTVKIVDETFGYVKCEKMDKTKTILGLEFSNSKQTKRTFQKIQEVIRILSLKDEWDGISSVHPADSRFFDAFLSDDIWTEYDSKIDMKRPKDYISSRPSDSLACCVAFTCGDEQNALNDRGDIKAGPILEHKLLFNPNDEDDRKHGADWCRGRLIALKSIEYPQNWNGENTKEHRKRGGRFVPWDHQVTKLYNRVFPSDVGYTMRRPEQPPSSPGHLDDVLLWRDPVVQYHSFIAQAVDPMMTVTYVSLCLSLLNILSETRKCSHVSWITNTHTRAHVDTVMYSRGIVRSQTSSSAQHVLLQSPEKCCTYLVRS